MQSFLTALILLCAVAYAAWRIYNTIRDGGDPCKGCELKEKCKNNRQNTCHCK